MEKIKVIFLDVDGVLNSDRTVRKTQGGYTFVDNRQMKNLKHIINMTGARSFFPVIGDTTETTRDTTETIWNWKQSC